MRIVVNDIAASSGGAMTILKQFYNYIKEYDTSNEWFFLLSGYYLEETDNIHIFTFPNIKTSKIKKIAFDCFAGKKMIASFNPDVVVSLQNIITFGVKSPQCVYVHQSIPFQKIKKFSVFKRNERSVAIIQNIIGAFIKQSVRKADKVFVQTKWMLDAVSQSVPAAKKKIFLAFPQVESMKSDLSKFDNKRFFYPTTTGIYKNNHLIAEACDLLVKEGIEDFEVRLTLPVGAIENKHIKCLGVLHRTEMQNEYQCGTLLFPSYIETVGLPLLEARSCQTMILASDTPFSQECLENYDNALYFSPFDAVGLKECMKKVILGSVYPEKVNERYLSRASWQEFYEEVLSCKKSFF